MARQLKVAVQMDPIDNINIDADSTFALMLEAQKRGHAMWHYEVRHMALREGVKRLGARALESIRPRARTRRLVTRDLGDELLVYDLDRHKAYCLNQIAMQVFRHCESIHLRHSAVEQHQRIR